MNTIEIEEYPMISVIIPAYNIEDLLEKCVYSVVGQTYPAKRMEIIIVDDGSTDNTSVIADRLSAEYDNIRVIHQKNGGSSNARNHGIREARGEYLGFVDSDDYLSPNAYEELMDAIVVQNVDMAQMSRDEISEDGSKRPDVVTPPQDVIVVDSKDHVRSLLMHIGDASFCTKLTKRSLFTEDTMFPEGILNEDFYLMIHMMQKIDALAVIPGQYYHVFYRSGSNSRKKATDKDYFPRVFTDIVDNADVAQQIVDNKWPDMHELAIRFGLIQRLDYLLHIPISKMTKDNEFYQKVVRYLRDHRSDINNNKYLTKKNRIYLMVLSMAPRFIRSLHAKVRGL